MNAVRMNPKSSLTHLDLSDNRLDDQCMEALCQMLSGLPHGLSTLELSDCGITTRGTPYYVVLSCTCSYHCDWAAVIAFTTTVYTCQCVCISVHTEFHYFGCKKKCCCKRCDYLCIYAVGMSVFVWVGV